MTTTWMADRHQSCATGSGELGTAGVAVSTRTTGAQKYLASSTVRKLTRRQWEATSAGVRR